MPRISGIDLPRQKRVEIALTYIYGIGRPSARTILAKAGVDFGIKADNLTDDEVSRIRRVIDAECKVEGDLRRDLTMNIKRLMDLGCYRGLRHSRGLPTRGQRTHTNPRTARTPSRS